ncbi:hypothetical protein KC19_1G117500 [Ceratodon purpureus]|uniref:Uncharacterized protein n=1 Tax=Ceratodon purpureus TaxID=3225 RepID=A0A8T0J402_CERPU|nr:hypothetical protein KC19_1G117500 [Ceratodon purpureus]
MALDSFFVLFFLMISFLGLVEPVSNRVGSRNKYLLTMLSLTVGVKILMFSHPANACDLRSVLSQHTPSLYL